MDVFYEFELVCEVSMEVFGCYFEGRDDFGDYFLEFADFN